DAAAAIKLLEEAVTNAKNATPPVQADIDAAELALKNGRNDTYVDAGGTASPAKLAADAAAVAETAAKIAAESASAVADVINPDPANVVRNPLATGSLNTG